MGSRLAVCFVVFAVAAPALADQPTQSPFQYFVGNWTCAGEFPSSHRPISSTLRFSLDETGALLKHHDDNPPNAYHAVELWAAGKDNAYQSMIAVPAFGVRNFRSPGWSNDSWVWTNASDAKPIDRFAYTRLDQTTMRVDWSVSKDGVQFALGDTLTCKRA